MDLQPTDYDAQEKLDIMYDHVPDWAPISSDEQERVRVMKRQLLRWREYALGDLNRNFIRDLGDNSNNEFLANCQRKRKRSALENGVRESEMRSFLSQGVHADFRRTYHAPSPPPLEDLLSGPSNTGVSRNSLNSNSPGINNTHPHYQPQLSGQPSHQDNDSTAQVLPGNEAPTNPGSFTSNFDLAFAKWVDEENISKAAIGRLLKDPAMRPITSRLSWKSVTKMKDRLESIEFHEVIE
ncbi:hypothetical protein KCU71_g5033, partial [Aureobasidium melanogenum]